MLAAELDRTGRCDLHPDRVEAALVEWRRIAGQSRRELGNASNDYTTTTGPDARDRLEAALHALPRPLARQLRQLVAPLDDAVVAKTLPDPFADPTGPWWRRRLADLYQSRALTPRERDHAYQQAGLPPPELPSNSRAVGQSGTEETRHSPGDGGGNAYRLPGVIGAEAGRTTAENYRRFAEREARGKSPLYEELAAGIAADNTVLELIDTLPSGKRQPNLVLAAARFLYGTPAGYPQLRHTLLRQWPQVRSVVLARSTQTNEVGRCAALLPVLAELPQPLALIEIGASAGLCLLLDRYHYDYGADARLGAVHSPVRLGCELRGRSGPPARLPHVVWRCGLDLDPVEVTDPHAVRWLETLVWPGQTARLHRLQAALALAADDPPQVVRGDLRTDLARLVAQAPTEATVVVFHSAVLAYLPPTDRARFAEHVTALDVTWLGYEAPGVVAAATPPAPAPDTDSAFLITRDAYPAAWADPHGDWLRRI